MPRPENTVYNGVRFEYRIRIHTDDPIPNHLLDEHYVCMQDTEDSYYDRWTDLITIRDWLHQTSTTKPLSEIVTYASGLKLLRTLIGNNTPFCHDKEFVFVYARGLIWRFNSELKTTTHFHIAPLNFTLDPIHKPVVNLSRNAYITYNPMGNQAFMSMWYGESSMITVPPTLSIVMITQMDDSFYLDCRIILRSNASGELIHGSEKIPKLVKFQNALRDVQWYYLPQRAQHVYSTNFNLRDETNTTLSGVLVPRVTLNRWFGPQ